MLWSQKNVFLIIKIHNFRGDVSDISAKKSSLVYIVPNLVARDWNRWCSYLAFRLCKSPVMFSLGDVLILYKHFWWYRYTSISRLAVRSSGYFLAEISVSSPGKLFIFIIYKNLFWIKVSKKIFDLILKKEALVRSDFDQPDRFLVTKPSDLSRCTCLSK